MIERVLEPFESAYVRVARLEPRWPPLFVVGAPRTGTTLANQVLLNAFHFAYLSNAANERRFAPVLATRRALREHDVPRTWESDYGRVEGALAPSDGWRLFKRWFPVYDDPTPPRTARLHELATIVRLLERLFDAPFLCKNNHHSTRIAMLAGLFPVALFVHVTRERADAAASLLEARRKHGVALGRWWSASPPEFHGRRFASELEQAVCTLRGLDDEIERALAALSPERRQRVDYAELCAAPEALLDWTRASYLARGVTLRERGGERPRAFAPRSRAGPRRSELEAEVREIEERLDREKADRA